MPFLPHQYISICMKSLLNSMGYLPEKKTTTTYIYIYMGNIYMGIIKLFWVSWWWNLPLLRNIFFSILSWLAAVVALLFPLSTSAFRISWILHTTHFFSYFHNNSKRCALGSHHFHAETLPAEKRLSWQQQASSITRYIVLQPFAMAMMQVPEVTVNPA